MASPDSTTHTTTTTNFLTVDEACRPRANSDPMVGAGCKLPTTLLLPEIRVEDCDTDRELSELHEARDQGGLFGLEATPRRRANTCPEDLFRRRNGRPPTPPPNTFRKGHRLRFGVSKPALKESVSFTHHKLSKLAESEDAEEPGSPPVSPATDDRLGAARDQSGVAGAACSAARGQGTTDRCCRDGEGSSPTDTDSCCREADGSSAKQRAAVPARFRSRDIHSAPLGSSKDSSDTGADSFLAQSSVKCRFSQSQRRQLDGKQLQAC